MSDASTNAMYQTELLRGVEETFERVQGIYLDPGTSLFETLESLSAGEASRAVAPGSATIAAQVEHVRFYLDVLEEVMRKGEFSQVDWREIWAGVGSVTPVEWGDQKRRLRESYERVMRRIRARGEEPGKLGAFGPIAVLAHTAYHLGGIRQAMAAIRAAAGATAASRLHTSAAILPSIRREPVPGSSAL
jgi:hypothetical protein